MRFSSLIWRANLLLLCFIVFAHISDAHTITTFNNSLAIENLTFTGNQNITRYFSIPSSLTLTSAFMNITGFSNDSALYTTSNTSNNFSWSGFLINTPGDINDNIWTSYEQCNNSVDATYPVTCIAYFNYTAHPYATDINYTFKMTYRNDATYQFIGTVDYWNYSKHDWQFLSYSNCNNTQNTVNTLIFPVCTRSIPSDGLNSTTKQIRIRDTLTQNSQVFSMRFFESNFSYRLGYYPSRVNITINNNPIIALAGTSSFDNRTTDFKTLINNNKTGCVSSNCIVAVQFHSDSAGVIGYSNILLSGTESVVPSFTLFSPNTTYTAVTYLPLNFTASDDVQLDTCWYNVTISGYTDIPNGYNNGVTDCYYNSSFFVSFGDGTYRINMCVNDTSGNTNCTTKTFDISDYIAPVFPSGGGGGGGTVTGNATWSMRTETGSRSFKLNMLRDTTRTRNLQFTNLGENEVPLSITCDGALCAFITLNQTALSLPVNVDKLTMVSMEIKTPSVTSADEYTANIKATDAAGNAQVVTVQVTLGGAASIFLQALNKLGDTKTIGSVKVPYIFIFLVIAGILFTIFNVIIFRGISIGFALSLILAFIVAFLALALL